jgi:hypothetical protein
MHQEPPYQSPAVSPATTQFLATSALPEVIESQDEDFGIQDPGTGENSADASNVIDAVQQIDADILAFAWELQRAGRSRIDQLVST